MTINDVEESIDIREVDVSSPIIYSLNWRDKWGKWEVLLEAYGLKYLVRQIYLLRASEKKLYDLTLNIKAIDIVRESVKGFCSPTAVIGWHDVMIGYETEVGGDILGENDTR